ncbi:Uncharacterised protein [uncultured archaeon]|nr:Uncharacterised protein [uncultured archaeon]
MKNGNYMEGRRENWNQTAACVVDGFKPEELKKPVRSGFSIGYRGLERYE